jgi:putative two-component system response regulator
MDTRSTIILVDDNQAELTMGRNIIKEYYNVIPVNSAAHLFEVLEKVMPELILLDIEMPVMNGYETIIKLKSDERFERFKEIPVIFLTAKNDDASELKGFDLGAMDFVTKPFSGPRLLKRIENQLLISRQRAELKSYTDNLERKVKEKTIEVFHLQSAILATVADLVEFRDKLTGGHIARTQLYLKVLINKMIQEKVYEKETSEWDLDFLLPSSQLHDVGKIAITDMILNKPGKLTDEEFDIMKTHVSVGVEAIETIMSEMESEAENAFLHHALLFVGTHHEKWNGTGYPKGLKEYEIPLEGRLMAIADVYDALISLRAYKHPFTHEEACKTIEDGAGIHFDPVLIDIFRDVKHEFEQIAVEIEK